MTLRSVAPRVAAWTLVAATALAATGSGAEEAVRKAQSSKITTTTEAVPRADAAHDAAMAEMMKYASPGPMHEKLKSMVGTWKAVVKTWAAPGEPTVTEGTSVNNLILGGRYVSQDYKGSMIGQPFEGMGLTGYDNRKKEFTSFWVDNSSTAMMTQTGKLNDKGDELVFKGRGEGPDGSPMEYRTVIRIVDENTHVLSMYAPTNGKEALWMEITYTRM